jgi:hypothetical protein
MRTIDMDDAKCFYNYEDDIQGLHVSMGNVETESNGHRNKVEFVELAKTMKRMQKEVQSYRAINERMTRAHEEILKILNML